MELVVPLCVYNMSERHEIGHFHCAVQYSFLLMKEFCDGPTILGENGLSDKCNRKVWHMRNESSMELNFRLRYEFTLIGQIHVHLAICYQGSDVWQCNWCPK